MTKGGKQEVATVGHNSYAGTRFNAVKHAIPSRFTVLPWEDGTEYGDVLEALVAEHKPEDPADPEPQCVNEPAPAESPLIPSVIKTDRWAFQRHAGFPRCAAGARSRLPKGHESSPRPFGINAPCRPNIERIVCWTPRDDGEDELGQGLREVERDMVEVIAEFAGEL